MEKRHQTANHADTSIFGVGLRWGLVGGPESFPSSQHDVLVLLSISRVNESEGGSGINEYVSSLFDQSLTWKDLEWLKSITHLPILVKVK